MRTREDIVDDLLVLAAQAGDVGAFERLATARQIKRVELPVAHLAAERRARS